MVNTRSLAGLAILCIGAVALGGEPAATTAIERVLPADTIAVVQATELGKLGAAFEQSALADALKASQLLRYLRTVAGGAVEFGSALLTGLPAKELGACVGQNAAIALLDFKDAADLRLRVPVVLLIEASDAKKLEAALLAQLQVFSILREDLAAAKQEHLGVAVHELRLPNGGPLAFAFVQGTLAVGSREGVRALISSQVGDTPRLAADANYRAIRQGLATPAGGLLAYVNARALLQRFGLLANPGQLMPLQAVGIANAQAAGLAIDFNGRQLRERLFVKLDGPPTGILRLLTEGEPAAPAAAKFVPQDYTLLLSMALRGVGLWDRFRALLQDTQGPAGVDGLEAMCNHIEQQLGFHPKKNVLDAFGDEAFLALDLSKFSSFHGAGRQPKPQELPIIFGARLRDAATLKATCDRLAANQQLWDKGVQRTTIEHQGVTIAAFRTPQSPELRPSLAIVDDVFLFSLRPEPLASALDAWKAGKTFPAPHAAAAPAHLTLQVNDALLLKSLLACVRNELPEAAKRLLPEADAIIAGLHGYRAALRRTQDGIVVEACSDIGTVGTLLAAIPMLDQGNAIIARRVNADFEQAATALEAYRTKHGTYPETLDQLVPDFLPTLVNDRFEPSRPYGYGRGRPGADGKLPDAWILTSVGPDHKPDIPVEQFDPPAWSAAALARDPEGVARLKALIYRFRPDEHPDERKNDDEGDLYRMGGKGIAPLPTPAVTPKKAGAAREDF